MNRCYKLLEQSKGHVWILTLEKCYKNCEEAKHAVCKEGHSEFDGQKSFIINSYYIAIDELNQSYAIRKAAHLGINDHFGFLCEIDEMETADVKEKASILFIMYISN